MIQKPVPKTLPSGKISKKSKVARNNRPRAIEFTREERDEMRKLQAMLPTPARVEKYEQDPCALLNDTACYINHLVATVHARVATGSLPREVLDQLMLASPTSSTASESLTPPTSPTLPKKLRRRATKNQ